MNKTQLKNDNGDFVTAEQAARRLNLSINTVKKYAIECGAALKIGRAFRINIQMLIDYLNTFKVEVR